MSQPQPGRVDISPQARRIVRSGALPLHVEEVKDLTREYSSSVGSPSVPDPNLAAPPAVVIDAPDSTKVVSPPTRPQPFRSVKIFQPADLSSFHLRTPMEDDDASSTSNAGNLSNPGNPSNPGLLSPMGRQESTSLLFGSPSPNGSFGGATPSAAKRKSSRSMTGMASVGELNTALAERRLSVKYSSVSLRPLVVASPLSSARRSRADSVSPQTKAVGMSERLQAIGDDAADEKVIREQEMKMANDEESPLRHSFGAVLTYTAPTNESEKQTEVRPPKDEDFAESELLLYRNFGGDNLAHHNVILRGVVPSPLLAGRNSPLASTSPHPGAGGYLQAITSAPVRRRSVGILDEGSTSPASGHLGPRSTSPNHSRLSRRRSSSKEPVGPVVTAEDVVISVGDSLARRKRGESPTGSIGSLALSPSQSIRQSDSRRTSTCVPPPAATPNPVIFMSTGFASEEEEAPHDDKREGTFSPTMPSSSLSPSHNKGRSSIQGAKPSDVRRQSLGGIPMTPHDALMVIPNALLAMQQDHRRRCSWAVTVDGIPLPTSSSSKRRSGPPPSVSVVDVAMEYTRYIRKRPAGVEPEEDEGECNCDEQMIMRSHRLSQQMFAGESHGEDPDPVQCDLSTWAYDTTFEQCDWCQRRPAWFACLHCGKSFCPSHVKHHGDDDKHRHCFLFVSMMDIATSFDKIFWCDKCETFTWKHTDCYADLADQLVRSRSTYLSTRPSTDILIHHYQVNDRTYSCYRRAAEDKRRPKNTNAFMTHGGSSPPTTVGSKVASPRNAGPTITTTHTTTNSVVMWTAGSTTTSPRPSLKNSLPRPSAAVLAGGVLYSNVLVPASIALSAAVVPLPAAMPIEVPPTDPLVINRPRTASGSSTSSNSSHRHSDPRTNEKRTDQPMRARQLGSPSSALIEVGSFRRPHHDDIIGQIIQSGTHISQRHSITAPSPSPSPSPAHATGSTAHTLNGPRIFVSCASMQGWRATQEDAEVVFHVNVAQLLEHGGLIPCRSLTVMGVFDGHGGDAIAKLSAHNFEKHFTSVFIEAIEALQKEPAENSSGVLFDSSSLGVSPRSSPQRPAEVKKITTAPPNHDDDESLVASFGGFSVATMSPPTRSRAASQMQGQSVTPGFHPQKQPTTIEAPTLSVGESLSPALCDSKSPAGASPVDEKEAHAPKAFTQAEAANRQGFWSGVFQKTLVKLDDFLLNTQEGRDGLYGTVGCTACIVGITDEEIICASAGDSRAVLCDAASAWIQQMSVKGPWYATKSCSPLGEADGVASFSSDNSSRASGAPSTVPCAVPAKPTDPNTGSFLPSNAVIPLSFDHKLFTVTAAGDIQISENEEVKRVRAAGYSISSEGRIEGMLAVPRALGDFDFKMVGSMGPQFQAVTCWPDVRWIPRSSLIHPIHHRADVSETPEMLAGSLNRSGEEQDQLAKSLPNVFPPTQVEDWFIAIGCDGIYDVLSNEALCTTIQESWAAQLEVQQVDLNLSTSALTNAAVAFAQSKRRSSASVTTLPHSTSSLQPCGSQEQLTKPFTPLPYPGQTTPKLHGNAVNEILGLCIGDTMRKCCATIDAVKGVDGAEPAELTGKGMDNMSLIIARPCLSAH